MSARAQWMALGAVLFTFVLLAAERHGMVVLWPSVLAITLAFVTRQIHVSLFLGAFAGAVLLAGGNVLEAFLKLIEVHLLPALSNGWNISVLVFTLLMGGLVEILNRGGGMQAMAERFLRGSTSPRRAGLGAYGLGWLLFIDGLANAMLVGKSMRPITDRVRMSREKLAFIVDSTSSPIAGLSLISTWVAYELSVIREGLGNAGASGDEAFTVLIQSIPFRFYNIVLLFIVFLVIWTGRDLGPMRKAEKAAASNPSEVPGGRDGTNRQPAAIWPVVVCLAALVLGVFVGLYTQGGGTLANFSLATMIQAFGDANAALVFVWATAGTSLLAMILLRFTSAQSAGGGVVNPFLEGMNHMFLPALILVLAWMLNSVIKELGAATYLAGWLGGALPPFLLPALTFVLGSVISFSTGTSWGTMAILMPLVIPVALGMPGGAETVLVPTIGSVLAGAVFGDHCSPISDTTIVSAVSSDCDPMAHVRTQLPYALIAAALALVIGCLPAGLGVSPWILLPFTLLTSWAVIRFLGKRSPVVTVR